MIYKDSRFWSSSSFELQLAFVHVVKAAQYIVLSQVLDSSLKSAENRHFDINICIANLNPNRSRSQRLRLRLRYDIPNYQVK